MTNMDYNSLSEDQQLRIVKSNPFYVKYIDNPSEEVQIASVTEWGVSIRWIRNPSEEVQLEALKSTWHRYVYENYIKELPNKTEWFYREFNRLKLIKGPLK